MFVESISESITHDPSAKKSSDLEEKECIHPSHESLLIYFREF